MVELQLHPIPYPRELLDRAQQDIKLARIGQRASGRVRSSAHEPGILDLEIGDDFVSRRRPSGRLH